MTTRRFQVKNPFYLGGVFQSAGSEIEVDDDQLSELVPKNVLGKEVVHDLKPPEGSANAGEKEPFSLEEFTALSAADQKSELLRLEIGGDASNKEDRIAVYAAHLAGGDPIVEDQTGGSTVDGAGGAPEDQGTA